MEMSSCMPEPAHSLIAETQAGKASTKRTLTRMMHLHLVYIYPCATPAVSWIQGCCHTPAQGSLGGRKDTWAGGVTPSVLLFCCWSRRSTQHQAAHTAGTQVLRERSWFPFPISLGCFWFNMDKTGKNAGIALRAGISTRCLTSCI